MSSLPTDVAQFWFSEFTSPSGNLHHFHLHLREDENSSMSLLKSRPDGSMIKAGFRVKSIRRGDYLVLAAADDSLDYAGLATMILRVEEAERRMEGRMMWYSASGGRQETESIVWTRETPAQDR